MSDMDLSDMDKDYEEADIPAGDFEPIKDGTYQTQVDTVEIVWSKKEPRRRMVKWSLRVLNPPYENRLVWKYNSIEREKLGWLKSDLGLAGLKLDKLSELPRRLHELLDVPLEIRLKTSTGKNGQDYQNCYFNRRLQFGEEDVPPLTDEDAPF